jgi:seryl-tRNA synthetase
MPAFAGITPLKDLPRYGTDDMHDIKGIRENPGAFDAGLKRRGLAPMSAPLLAIDEKRRAAILKSEQAQARRNVASKEIGEAKKAKDDARASVLMAEVADLKTTMPELEAAAKVADEELAKELAAIPNLPLDEVPDGADEHGNVQHHVFGAVRNYAFKPKPHDDLGVALGFMDSCSIFTPASTAMPRSIRRCWCATT